MNSWCVGFPARLEFELSLERQPLSMPALDTELAFCGGLPVSDWKRQLRIMVGTDTCHACCHVFGESRKGRGDVVPGCSSLSSCGGRQGMGALRVLLPELYGDNPVCRRIVAEQGLSRSMRSANDGTFVGSMFRSFVAVLPATEARSMVSGWPSGRCRRQGRH